MRIFTWVIKLVYDEKMYLYKNKQILLGAQLISRCFFDENATLLWKNNYKWFIKTIAHR